LILFCALGIEIIVRLNLFECINIIYKTIRTAQKVILSTKISDHWKEKAVPSYAMTLLVNSLKSLIILVCLGLAFFMLVYLSPSLMDFTFSIKGIIESIVIAYLYILIRKKFV